MLLEARQSLEFLKVQYRALLRVGLDMGAVRGKDFMKNLPLFIVQAIITCYLQYGLFIYAVHYFKVKSGKATGALSMFNQGSLLMLKVMVLIYKKDRVLKLIWDMNLLAERANPIEHETWISENNRANLISKIYASACYFSVTCSAVIPIIFMSYEHVQGLEVHLKLPFDGEFPYEDLGVPIFILNYILSFLYVNVLLSLTLGVDTFFGWTVHAVSGHFRILRLKVGVAAQKIDLNGNHEEFVQDVGSIVRYHNKIIQFVNDLNHVFGEILWAEVMFSCLQICFLIYSLNNDPDKRAMPFTTSVLIAICIQMMIYCFGGEKNNMLCEDIYVQFPWEKMYPSEKKLMLLPLMRSQKVTSLVGLFFELDRNLLVYICRTAFSFNALLVAMKE